MLETFLIKKILVSLIFSNEISKKSFQQKLFVEMKQIKHFCNWRNVNFAIYEIFVLIFAEKVGYPSQNIAAN